MEPNASIDAGRLQPLKVTTHVENRRAMPVPSDKISAVRGQYLWCEVGNELEPRPRRVGRIARWMPPSVAGPKKADTCGALGACQLIEEDA